MGVYEELKARGMVAQMTDEETIIDLLNNQKCTFYIGFDPTADSLHVGHFVQIMVMAHMQRAGHRPIALFGGGTALVGDPSGKTDMRKMLTEQEIGHNIDCFKQQMSRLVDFSDGRALMVNNADWLMHLNYIQFLREIGVHFSVNRMLSFECYKQRMECGLTFFELNYMIMQSYDFLMLNQQYDCVLQLGGNDQWSNILGGVELIRRVGKSEGYGMTFALLLTSDGRKMGKTEQGAVWLDPIKTPPYDFYQYWRNVDDSDVIKCLKILTFVPLDEIAQYEKLSGSSLNPVKERLAYEVTALIHGRDEANRAQSAAHSVFSGAASDNMPSTRLTDDDFTDGAVGMLDLLLKCGLVPSKGEGRRLIQQGGLTVDDQKVTDAAAQLLRDDMASKGHMIIRKGKKVYHKVSL